MHKTTNRAWPPAAAGNRSSRVFLWSALLLVIGLLPVTVLAANVEEDDEETLGGDPGFSIPADVADAKRQVAETTGFSLLLGASAFWGNDDNVFRSPIATAKSSDAKGNWGYLRTDARWRSVNRFLTTVTWKQTEYPGHSAVDASHAHMSNWYTRPLSATTSCELDFDVSHKTDDAATILGTKYTRGYSYWRYASEGVLMWEPGDRSRFRLSGEGVLKNYDETPGLNSIDWTQWMSTLAYRLRVASSQSLSASYALGQRRYSEEPASLRTGAEAPENPAEHHRYRELTLTYAAPVARMLDFNVKYDHTAKDDLFDGYESNRSQGVLAGVDLKVADRLQLRVEGERVWRDYENITGDNGRRLSYTTLEGGLGARYHLVSALRLFAGVSRYERKTNKRTGSSYRDYHGTLTRMGMSLFL